SARISLLRQWFPPCPPGRPARPPENHNIPRFNMQDLPSRLIPLFATALLGASGLAHAERPLNVDDAGTLDKGGAKLEAGWSKDDEARGFEAAAGFGPIDNVEMEIGFARTRDHASSPTDT